MQYIDLNQIKNIHIHEKVHSPFVCGQFSGQPILNRKLGSECSWGRRGAAAVVRRCFIKSVLKRFSKFTVKVVDVWPATLLKRDFDKNTFFIEQTQATASEGVAFFLP